MNKQEFSILPYNSKTLKNNNYLVSNFFGAWDFLNQKEFRKLNSLNLSDSSSLFRRLHNNGLIVSGSNLDRLLADYRKLNANLFSDTSLHIAVLTTRCNLECRYCQTKMAKQEDMSLEVASRVLNYLFSVNTNNITLEFQGGEPLLNWKTLAFLVENARKLNKNAKNLKITIVSNLLLLDKKKMRFFKKYGVEICSSFDGPKKVHDKNRVLKNGAGTYDIVLNKIKQLGKEFGMRVNLLPTITKYSLKHYKEIIDEYVRLKQDEICLRPVNKLGFACSNWDNLGYSPEEFTTFYQHSLNYILTLNRKGVKIKERMARLICEKVINKTDPGYVELMTPCGSGRNTIVYMPSGTCYPCDEARMMREDAFKLGNILNENYSDMIKKENLVHLLEASVLNLWDYNNAFLPWMGTCPVVNYGLQGNLVPKIWCSPMHKISNFQFEYIFDKMAEKDGNTLKIFENWIGKPL